MERSIDIEKVIKRLENTAEYFRHLQSVGFFGDQPVYREHEQNCNNAIAMLKDREAKPVIVTTNAYGTRFYHCPKCSRDLYIYPRQLYCSNCGQAVKWE